MIENMAEAARQGCLWLGGLIEPLEAACTARVWFIIGLALIAAALIAHLKRQRIPQLEVEPLLGELQRGSRRRATCDGRLAPPIALPCRAAVGDAEGGKSPSTKVPKGSIPCYDPGTLQLLGHAPAFTEQQVCLWDGGGW